MSELSVLVPVYNEERTIAGVMQRIAVALPESQIIYIDDGSRDGSLARIREHARPRDIIMTKKNGGKGSAIREGLAKATGTFTVIQDADAEYDPSEIMRLLARAKELPGTIVFGSRFLTKNPNLYKRYLLGNKALTGFINLLFGVHLTDSYTCYKLFPTALMQSLPLRANGFELEAELTCLPLCKRHTIVEVPITYKPRSLEEGKKIRFKDAVKGVMRTIGIRITGR